MSNPPFDPKRVGVSPQAAEKALNGLIELTVELTPAPYRLEYLSRVADVLDTFNPRPVAAGENIVFGAAAEEVIYEAMSQALSNVRAARGCGE